MLLDRLNLGRTNLSAPADTGGTLNSGFSEFAEESS